ncbi:MAG: FAD-binding oxidoreductase, partial [Comamonas sp.]|nr:FAD-binding oxidoreductase [Candidatus Comamonas equi]
MVMTRRQVLLGTGAVVVVGGAAVAVPMLRRPGHMVPSVSRAAPVQGDTDMPAQADVVVVGAGIMGVATAFYLAERGLSVVVCEKGTVACEQSSRAYGQATSWGQKPEVAGLGEHSKLLWSGMNAKLGADTSFRGYGRVQAFDNDEDIEKAREWLQKAQAHAPPQAPLIGRFLEGAALAQLIPGAQKPWKMGLYIANDGGLEPAPAAPAVARGAQKLGVKIITQCAVRGVETAAGAVSGVVTEKGPIRAKSVVVAGGSWSRLLLGNADINLPVLPAYLSQQRLSAVNGAPPAVGAAGLVVWRKEVDGNYSNGPRYMTAPVTRDS